MLKKLLSKLDPKYVKVCLYAGVTIILVVLSIFLLNASSGFWRTLWTLFSAVLRPVVIGLIFSYLLTPVVEVLENKFHEFQMDKLARPLAVIASFILFLAVIAAFVGVVGFMIFQSFSSLRIGNIQSLINFAQRDLSALIEIIQRKLMDFGLSASTIRQIITTIANAVSNLTSGLLFGAIFSVYFLLDENSISKYWARAYHLIAGHKAEAQFKQLSHDADRVFSGYIRGQFIDATIVGVLTSMVLSIAGIPRGAMIGVLTGFGNLIPYVGPVVGYITLGLVCLSTGAYAKLAIGAVCLALILFVDGNIINPRLLSNNIKIHPLLVIIALIGGGAIGGFLGMIVAVPTAALLKVQLDRYLDKKESSNEALLNGAAETARVAGDAVHKTSNQRTRKPRTKKKKDSAADTTNTVSQSTPKTQAKKQSAAKTQDEPKAQAKPDVQPKAPAKPKKKAQTPEDKIAAEIRRRNLESEQMQGEIADKPAKQRKPRKRSNNKNKTEGNNNNNSANSKPADTASAAENK